MGGRGGGVNRGELQDGVYECFWLFGNLFGDLFGDLFDDLISHLFSHLFIQNRILKMSLSIYVYNIFSSDTHASLDF